MFEGDIYNVDNIISACIDADDDSNVRLCTVGNTDGIGTDTQEYGFDDSDAAVKAMEELFEKLPKPVLQ